MVDLLADAARWTTFRCEHQILAVARTLTSAIRLLEAMAVFQGDPRVGIVFTVDPGSRFSTGVDDFLRSLDATVVPWETAPQVECSLVITASEKIDLPQIGRVPLLVLPHGIGFHKYVPDVDGPGVRLSGLVAPGVLRRGRVRLLVTHPDQQTQLAAVTPDTIGRTVLGGDTSYDGLLASLAARERYRRALGVADHQRLIMMTSTWQDESLLGVQPDLLDRLLGELPADEYRVAAVIHPNVWTWHGSWEVRRTLDRAIRAGLLLIDPTEGWHGTLIAADAVVGDHGSVGLYAAAIGKPVLLGASSADEVVPGTPLADVLRATPVLDHGEPLRPQIDKLVATHDVSQMAGLADRLFARPEMAARILRTLCYQHLGLAEPDDEPPVFTMPEPVPAVEPVRSYEVVGRVVAGSTVTLSRYPASVRAHCPTPHPEELRHLAVGLDERNVRLFGDAAVLVDMTSDRAHAEMLQRHPGCRLVASPATTGCAITLRDGRHLLANGEPAIAASAVYTVLIAGGEVIGQFTVRVGAIDTEITVREA